MKEYFWAGFGAIVALFIVFLIVRLAFALGDNQASMDKANKERCDQFIAAVARVAEVDPSDAVILGENKYYVCL